MIYHLLTPAAWQKAQAEHGYTPEAFAQVGFIHCSDLYQVRNTANHFYRELPELLVLEIDPKLTGLPLVYENLEGGRHDLPSPLWQPAAARIRGFGFPAPAR